MKHRRALVPWTWVVLAAAPWATGPAVAAESLDSCTAYVDVLPATLSTQGTWCLRANLATSATTGAAITIAATNVVLDCNHFTVDGSGAGAGTQAAGVLAQNRQAAVVRNCVLRGFYRGMQRAGNHIEVRSSRVDAARFHGEFVAGDDVLVQDVAVLETGGSTAIGSAIGIYALGRVDTLGSFVAGTRATAGSGGNAIGIYYATGSSGSVRDNRVFGVTADGAGATAGIKTDSAGRVLLSRNHVVSAGGAGTGLLCEGPDVASGSARDNAVAGFATGWSGCPDDGARTAWSP